jgi:D-alanyl-D-alanine carboxypeptidase (penicillin-binding protein 5/6)
LAVSSGNDAAVAAALFLAPSVREFADMMTAEARRMGLYHTRFVEPSGISEYNMTTAAEFAAFCREYIRLYPESLKEFHSVQTFAYPQPHNVAPAFRDNPNTIEQSNRNNLLRTFYGVDGLKTGFIFESGFNIALTAQRDGSRFILVLLGAPAETGGVGIRIRDADGQRLLNWAFDNFKTVRLLAPRIENARLWKGKANEAELKLAGPVEFTSPVDRAGSLWSSAVINEPLIAPLPANYQVGDLVFYDEEGDLNSVALLTARAYEQGNIFKRLWHSLRLLFRR